MTRKLLFSAIATAIGLLGCAGADTRSASPCNAGVCKIDVTVTDCLAIKGVSVSVPDLDVINPNNIEWSVTSGYVFPPNGIIIGADPQGEISKPVVAPNGKKVTVHNKHRQTNYKIYYAVNVTKEDGTPCVPIDPWIYNR